MKTGGYDYVFALGAGTVNAILASDLAKVRQTISYTAKDADSGSTVTLDAELAPWQLVAGGGNTLIHLNLPISQGSLSLAGGAITGHYDLSGVTPEMVVTLGWVGTGDKQVAKGSGDLTHLTFNPDPSQGQGNPGYVATVAIHDPGRKLDTVAAGILTEVMADALAANRDTVAYIFANVIPTPPQLSSWLAPGEWQYFVSKSATSPDGVLCFLCMLGQGATLPADPSFDSSALQPGADAVVLISQSAFFANVVLPAVRSALPGGTFQLGTDTGSPAIRNSGDFSVGQVSASSYELTASPAGNGLAVNCSGGGPLEFLFGLANLPDASYSWSLSTVNPVSYDGKAIAFAADPSPVSRHDFTMYWYDWLLLVAVGITTSVGLASAISDMVNNFADEVQNVGMSNISSGVQAATGGTVVNLAQVIDWTKDGQHLTPTNASMSESIFVAGNLAVPHA